MCRQNSQIPTGKKKEKKENHTGFVGIRGTFITEVKYVSSRTRLEREREREKGKERDFGKTNHH